ncbi:Helix-turn-helix domain-containing protein [Streptomyces zhaozhouensis]|uniref:Helix-turn-helix domain-containing protein n=1 Tax=Streptomyces zhaozhouensis TaxID=1300267 RepID=A0A286DPT6_9ACTN|nr:helix-turn-helix transcriptional regulator [Streptomyces zhaozhouensis]SOD60692.1 Helix-turn-helix domain-containing protein [Streptomyces zhaozhouensis]
MSQSQGPPAADPAQYDQQQLDALLATELGRLIHDRRIELGLSRADLAERAEMTPPQVARIEGGGSLPTLQPLHRLVRALDGVLNVSLDANGSRITLTPHAT